MSQPLLPQTVRIKRKRQDEPVDTLHVQAHDDPKKRRFTLDQPASAFSSIFRRVQEPDGAAAPPTAAAPAAAGIASSSGSPAASAGAFSRPSSSRSADRRILTPLATRRFHLSTRSHSGSGPPGGIQKRKHVATLVETKPKKTRTEELPSAVAEYVAQKTARRNDDVQIQMDKPRSPPLKRPGRTARSSSPPADAGNQVGKSDATCAGKPNTIEHDSKASSNNQSKDNSSNKTAASNAVDPTLLFEMQKFAQEVESNEQKTTPKPTFQPTAHSPHKLKFQPKAVPRYRDRHPDTLTTASGTHMNTDNQSDSESDAEYVYDTYIRYDGPADTLIDPLNSSALPPNIGLLVISAEDQPLWEAYLSDNADHDSERDWNSEDEDENAEDFYGNEYPEEEVASDDERDQGAYGYRVNASDEEEYGLWSDEEESLKRPWGRAGRPGWLTGERGKGTTTGGDSDDEDGDDL